MRCEKLHVAEEWWDLVSIYENEAMFLVIHIANTKVCSCPLVLIYCVDTFL